MIGSLYDVATNTNKWRDFLANLCAATKSDGAHLAISSFDSHEMTYSIRYGEHQIDLAKYIESLNLDDEGDAFGLRNPFKPFHCGMMPSQEEFRKSKLHTEFLEPNGVHYHLGVMIPEETKRRHLACILWRDKDGGSYTSADCDLLGEIVPHLRRVVDLQHHFHRTQFQDNPALDVLETLPLAVMLCDVGAHVLFHEFHGAQHRRSG